MKTLIKLSFSIFVLLFALGCKPELSNEETTSSSASSSSAQNSSSSCGGSGSCDQAFEPVCCSVYSCRECEKDEPACEFKGQVVVASSECSCLVELDGELVTKGYHLPQNLTQLYQACEKNSL